MDTLATIRIRANIKTQSAFAQALGLKGRAVVAKWETGASYPRTQLLPQVAKLLNVTVDDVIAAIEASRNTS